MFECWQELFRLEQEKIKADQNNSRLVSLLLPIASPLPEESERARERESERARKGGREREREKEREFLQSSDLHPDFPNMRFRCIQWNTRFR